MKFSEYCQLDALELARRVRSGEVRARELAELAIQQAEKIQPILNPICQPLYDKARQTANTQGQVDGTFAGVPFLVKDLGMHVAGTPTTMGCKAFRNAVAEQDSEYVRRCRRAGLVIIGKTTTPELGLKATTETALWGATRNPWNPEHTPGGSSGGSAAAVAAGVVPMASADDGGGSIRIPAAYCGLFGLKPTRGRVSYAPDAAESWSGAGARGVVSLSVRDSAAAIDFLQGVVPGEPYVIAPPANPYQSEVGRDPGNLRIAWSATSPIGTKVDPEIVAATEAVARRLEAMGHRVEEAQPEVDGAMLMSCYLRLYFGEVAADMAEAIEGGAIEEDFERDTRLLGLLGRTLPLTDYVRSRLRWNTLSRALGEFYTRYDIWLTPTTALPAARIGELEPSAPERLAAWALIKTGAGTLLHRSGLIEQLAMKNMARTPFTQLANLTGTPAMSVPLAWHKNGLPIGLQFGAAMGREDLLFRLAGQLERAMPWMGRRPVML